MDGVRESQADGMKHRPLREFSAPAIKNIADDRQTGLREMDADLVGPPRPRLRLNVDGALETLKNLEIRPREIPAGMNGGESRSLARAGRLPEVVLDEPGVLGPRPE